MFASIVRQTRMWYDLHYAHLSSAFGNRKGGVHQKIYSYEIHRIRGDATHTPVALRNKAHSLEVASCFRHARLAEDPEPGDDEDQDNCLLSARQTAWAEIRPVPDPCAAATLPTLYLKQAGTVGAKAWAE